jgi:ribosomal-protein-alanine N-acetyltransferase
MYNISQINLPEQSVPILITKRLIIRPLIIEDISPQYIEWLNSKQVTRYLEIRNVTHTLDTTIDYIRKRNKNAKIDGEHFGIFDDAGRRHVGTVTFNSTNFYHNTSDISFVIGNQETAGRGYATEAVHAVCCYGFIVKKLYKITGGHYAGNIGSKRVFQKNGFRVEGCRREQVINCRGIREDTFLYGLLLREFSEQPIPQIILKYE